MERATAASLMTIHSILYERSGDPQWWPAETPFEVCIGAILTQNTAWTNVERAISNLKGKALMDPFTIVSAPIGELARTIAPAGFHNQKAEYLRTFSAMLAERYRGDLDGMRDIDSEALREELLALKGVGEETADSMLCYAFGRRVLVIDAYTYRVMWRLFGPPWFPSGTGRMTYGRMQARLMGLLQGDSALYNRFHALIVIHAKGTCRKRPLCAGCPLKDVCLTFSAHGSREGV